MRILIDDEDFSWGAAWRIVTNTFFYTNHTVLPVRLLLHLFSLINLYVVCVTSIGSPREMVCPACGTCAAQTHADHL
jgi:glucan phosphorylase